MKIGYIQTNPEFGDKEANFTKVEVLSHNMEADLLVLPELFATGYTFTSKAEAVELAENKTGLTSIFLQNLALETGAVIIAGFIEADQENIYNSALIVSKDGVIDTYRKIHLYYKEKLWFNPGNLELKVYDINGIKFGVMICFDWIFPEVVRTLALKGANIIVHPANLVLPYCQNAMVTRSISNRVYTVTCNRIGHENRGDDDFIFTGGSQITSYNGEVLSSAPKDREITDLVEINLDKSRNKRLNEYNDLFKDRNSSLYVL
jgi:predicted amidohydrolase